MTQTTRLLLPLLLLCCPAAEVGAQAPPGEVGSFGRVEQINNNTSSYFYHVHPGAATIQVYVYGTVRAPGIYEVDKGTHLGKLLALSGGPILNPRQRDQRRKVTLKLMRPASRGEAPLYEANLEEAIGDQEQYPPLQDGDVLIIETIEGRKFSWRDGISIVGAASALSLAVVRAIAYAR